MALLSGASGARADVIAVDFCEFLVLERRDFNQFMARHPELRAAVDKMAARAAGGEPRARPAGQPGKGHEQRGVSGRALKPETPLAYQKPSQRFRSNP